MFYVSELNKNTSSLETSCFLPFSAFLTAGCYFSDGDGAALVVVGQAEAFRVDALVDVVDEAVHRSILVQIEFPTLSELFANFLLPQKYRREAECVNK